MKFLTIHPVISNYFNPRGYIIQIQQRLNTIGASCQGIILILVKSTLNLLLFLNDYITISKFVLSNSKSD